MMAVNPGKRFERKFQESCPGFVRRISDKLVYWNGRLLSDETEADFYVAHDNHAHLIECKATSMKSLPFAKVKEHQEEALAEFDAQGDHMHGWLAVEFYDDRGYRYPRRMFLVPIGEWLHFKANTNRASMPLKTFEEVGVECPQKGAKYRIPL